MRIFCDFDGTIALTDTTDWILTRFADPAWVDIERKWVAGRISARECMKAQIALIRASDADIETALNVIEIDPGFGRFSAWAAHEGIPLTIVSDGVGHFIRHVLARCGFSHLPLVVNEWEGGSAKRLLRHPYSVAGCDGGVCKCESVKGAAPTIFVGDGRSDFCVSSRVDLLFAKGALLEHARANDIAHLPFLTFDDITEALAARLAAPRASLAVSS